MSPRPTNPSLRSALVDIAARLLAEKGQESLSTRQIAAQAGCSTMAVYTYFGGMSGLIREVVHEGFARLQGYLTRVAQTADPVADMSLLGRAYRHNALANAHLYTVMFGSASIAGFSLTEEDRQHGRYTLGTVVDCASRCMAAGRFLAADPTLVAHQMWISTHGLVTLELGEYLISPHTAARCFETQLTGLMVSAGDTWEAAGRSVTRSLDRLDTEIKAVRAEPVRGASPLRT